MKCLLVVTLTVFLSLPLGCKSVRSPDAKATVSIWKTDQGIVTHTTVNGETYVTVTNFEEMYK